MKSSCARLVSSPQATGARGARASSALAKPIGVAWIGESRLIQPAEFFGGGVDMDEIGARVGDVEQGETLRGNFAEPPAEQDGEVGIPDARDQLRIGTDAEIAGVARVRASNNGPRR